MRHALDIFLEPQRELLKSVLRVFVCIEMRAAVGKIPGT
jgi:hypothetical protein